MISVSKFELFLPEKVSREQVYYFPIGASNTKKAIHELFPDHGVVYVVLSPQSHEP